MKSLRFTLGFDVIRAYWKLICFDLYLARGDFSALYGKVRRSPLGNPSRDPQAAVRICRAVDIACVFYWKQVRCLQRSAAADCLLKARGIPAVLVLGTQQMPFRAHAWVEVNGRVVNDKPYTQEMYAVLDRC